jgi:hypothetical protein
MNREIRQHGEWQATGLTVGKNTLMPAQAGPSSVMTDTASR